MSLGIKSFDGTGAPRSTPRAAQHCVQLRPPTPARHLLSRMLRFVADGQYEALVSSAAVSDQVRLRSAAGPSAGASFVAPLSIPGVSFTDREFRCALLWRLGVQRPAPQGYCHNWSSRRQEECQELVDGLGDHAVCCPCGPLSVMRHERLADIWADIFEELGAIVRRELYVHALSSPAQEAWLDIAALGVPELSGRLFDVTVRHPRDGRYLPRAAEVDGAALVKADEEKQGRYGSSSGAVVDTLGHETWGRLGEAAEKILMICSGLAAHRDLRRGRLPSQYQRRWRAQLDACLHRAVASQLDAAQWGLPGREHGRRRCAVDVAALECTRGWCDR